ncbi:MAG: hypothetical protein QY310_16010 [Candidatus Jettenia sp. CY-1]|nr:MAG: hypothetical protein QY310_16010 [Candidatus Jettenia sp. CY-1]
MKLYPYIDFLTNNISVTSKLLGHHNIQTTAGFYIHHDLNSKRDAVAKLENHILKPIKKPDQQTISQID